MRKRVFELCAETVEACVAARDGGADRIELCSALREGGLTPSHDLLREAVQLSGLPVHAMVRPRGGGFVYSDDELAGMSEDVTHFKSLGAAGVVLGVLRPDRTVDTEATRRLVELAQPMEVTFHRAIDETRSLREALEQVIAAGCGRVLSSGGAENAAQGAEMLAALVNQAAERIEVAVGCGLRISNALDLVRLTGARQFHGTLRVDGKEPCAEDVRRMVDLLRGE